MLIDRDSKLWLYLPPELQGLVEDGEVLVDTIYPQQELRDVSVFSFLVFSFAKAYEGFLKRLFFDLKMISHDDYYGDEIRIGKILNPNYTKKKGNVFMKLCARKGVSKDLPTELWKMWHRGRNRVFHYFPRNFRKLSYEEAVNIVRDFVAVMHKAVEVCDSSVDKE